MVRKKKLKGKVQVTKEDDEAVGGESPKSSKLLAEKAPDIHNGHSGDVPKP